MLITINGGDWFVASSTTLNALLLTGEEPMATTTPEAIRDRALTVIEGLTPQSDPSVKFRRYRPEGKVRLQEWAEANLTGALRRVEVMTSGGTRTPASSNTDTEEHEITLTVLVSYVRDQRFGRNAALDLHDVMDQDAFQIDQAIGMCGAQNFSPPYADATWIEGSPPARVEGTSCEFIEITYRFTYWRER